MLTVTFVKIKMPKYQKQCKRSPKNALGQAGAGTAALLWEAFQVDVNHHDKLVGTLLLFSCRLPSRLNLPDIRFLGYNHRSPAGGAREVIPLGKRKSHVRFAYKTCVHLFLFMLYLALLPAVFSVVVKH